MNGVQNCLIALGYRLNLIYYLFLARVASTTGLDEKVSLASPVVFSLEDALEYSRDARFLRSQGEDGIADQARNDTNAYTQTAAR